VETNQSVPQCGTLGTVIRGIYKKNSAVLL